MSEYGRGTFSCRIDGRAGYLRLFDDRLELIRSGRRGPQVLGPEIFLMHQVTRISTGKPGLILTAVELVVAGGPVELKLPNADARGVADLLELLARAAVEPPPVPAAPAAAALAELEDLLGQTGDVPPVAPGNRAIPAQPSEAVLTLAPAPEPAVPRPVDLPPDLAKRLSRLETLRSCGVMSEADYAASEAEIFALAWAESKSA